MEWSDVETIIRIFVEMGATEAVRLERARKLAAAVHDIARNSN
jgi:hypothetical protein